MRNTETNNGKKGGLLKGKPHYDKNGNSIGGIKAIVVDTNKPVELEGGEVIINKEASKKYWKELSKINQSAGNGVPILPPNEYDEDPSEYKDGGNIIDFNPNHVPSKRIINYAKNIKQKYPKIWDLGGNIFGNEAFVNLERVSNRGYWLDSEEWMYIKWRSYVARHQHDFRIEGVIAMLKWADNVNKGWAYMKDLIEAKIEKQGWKTNKTIRMKQGGNVKSYSFVESTTTDGKKIFKIFDFVPTHKEVFDYYKNSKQQNKEGVEIVDSNIKIETFTNFDSAEFLKQANKVAIKEFNSSIDFNKSDLMFKFDKINLQVYPFDAKLKDATDVKISVIDGVIFMKTTHNKTTRLKQGGEVKLLAPNGGKVGDCLDYIKNSESIKNNGYYLHFNNLNNYVDSNSVNIPKINSLCLITFNDDNQKNLKAVDTINSILLASEIAKLLNIDIEMARIIVYEQTTQSKPFTMDMLDGIKNENIIVADKDTIVCTNLSMQYDKGGEIEQYKEQGILEMNIYPTNSEHAKEYGINAQNPLYIQNLTVKESDRLKNLNEYAKNNGHDVIFGHIIQKAKSSKEKQKSFLSDVEMIKNCLHNNGYSINQDNNDFHKVLTDKQDSVTMDIPLLIRTLELAREDVKSDAELHYVVENLLKLKNKKVLTMDDYEYIVNVKSKHISKMEDGGNINNDYKVGDSGFYGAKIKENVTITKISPKIITFITDSGETKKYYTAIFEKFFKSNKLTTEPISVKSVVQKSISTPVVSKKQLKKKIDIAKVDFVTLYDQYLINSTIDYKVFDTNSIIENQVNKLNKLLS
jgi:hypothetical protein